MKEIYLEKIHMLQEVLTLTENVVFKQTPEDVDVYADMMAQREVLFAKAKAADHKLSEAGYTGKEPEAKEYRQQIAALAKRIIENDSYMKDAVSRILDGAKSNVKSMNEGKHLNHLYGNTAYGSVGTGFDWSQ